MTATMHTAKTEAWQMKNSVRRVKKAAAAEHAKAVKKAADRKAFRSKKKKEIQ